METSAPDYLREIMEKGAERIKSSHPDASDFRYIGTRPFLDGTLLTIDFAYEGTRGSNLIYEHDGKVEYFRNEVQLVASLGSTERPPGFITTLLKKEHVAGIIALILLFVIIAFLFRRPGEEVPAIVANAFTLVLGFYVGQKT